MADDVAALEKRIVSLESKYNLAVGIVVAVSVIFGASGAWGSWLLSQARKKIEGLDTDKDRVSAIYRGFEGDLKNVEATAVANVNSSARDALKREADNQLADLSNRITNVHSGWGAVFKPNLVVVAIDTDHPPYPELDDHHTCPNGYYVTGAVIVRGTFTFQCRQVGIVTK